MTQATISTTVCRKQFKSGLEKINTADDTLGKQDLGHLYINSNM